ncbi:MAG TPA: glycoside hydrolase family 43 protein [Arachidicoccus soli]|uniref:Arabinan endo-1,5-alpha-L-arabinosidase n=1 Tax=Arachidicoccus soli TaxID=2341117 RepID=A0A386HM91_9BACT|nr:glycoside hydrolase family 43 protein [Arachidicoccus soli]AYD46792.1 arabinan endo-1,5-alpha-L-arabinosidase [Arachidicoccus soli]HEU0226193.1 glycoside hydrolase family 43 protein [Arachidicoccus soli]
MKKLFNKCCISFLCILVLTIKADAQKKKMSGNPIFKGWYADPEATIYGNQYWIYPTYSAKYEDQVFIDAFSSYDLIHWTKHHSVVDTSEIHWAKRAMWAPAVLEKAGKYYIFFGANDVHPGEIGGIGVAVADNPAGPFRDLLKKPLINKIVNGAQPIDQFVFKDDSSYYMYYGGWGHCNVVKLKNDFTGIEPFSDGSYYKEITPKDYVEGPCMIKRKGIYYFMWSEGGWGGPNYRVAYAMSRSPLGPFKRVGVILQQNPNIATGAGHHSVIKIPGKDKYYIIYHRRPLGDNQANDRQVCIDEMHFDKAGRILPVTITKEGVKAYKLK